MRKQELIRTLLILAVCKPNDLIIKPFKFGGKLTEIFTKSKMSTILTLLLVISAVTFGQSAPNIVIVGAGASGTSCAYYIKQLVPQASITILEAKGRIGGRIIDTTVDGIPVSVGGAVWPQSNQYITELAKSFNITTKAVTKTPPMVWNGNKFTDPAALRKKLSNHKSNKNLGKSLTKYTGDLGATYDKLSTDNSTFVTIPDLLKIGGLSELMGVSASKFLSDGGVKNSLPEFVVEPLLLDAFGQDLNAANAIASMMGFDVQENTAYMITGGASQLLSKLMTASKAVLSLNSTVTLVTNTSAGYQVIYNQMGKDKIAKADMVVLAAPLETGIKFKGFQPLSDPTTTQPKRKYYARYSYYVVAGAVDPKYFNQSDSWAPPAVILTDVNHPEPWFHISLIDKTSNGYNLYGLFSSGDILEPLHDFFVDVVTVYSSNWQHAVPELKPTSNVGDFQAVQIASGLYNTNAIESVASSIELSLMAAQNIAKLIKNQAAGL